MTSGQLAMMRGPVVYFIRAGCLDFVKIGKTNNVSTRLSEIQTGCPVECAVIAVLPCATPGWALDIERRLHMAFSDSATTSAVVNSQGEWFQGVDALISMVRPLRGVLVASDYAPAVNWRSVFGAGRSLSGPMAEREEDRIVQQGFGRDGWLAYEDQLISMIDQMSA